MSRGGALFQAAALVLLLCLCFFGGCHGEASLTDLTGLLGGPKSTSHSGQAVPVAAHRVGLHATAAQTCGNVSFPCPGGFTAKPPTTVCNSTTSCTLAECCTANPTCGSASVACDSVSAPLDPATVCGTSVCTTTECCAGLVTSSSSYLRMILQTPCTGLTQDQFKAQIQAATGVPASAVVITSFSCTAAGLDVTLATLGSTPALANNALNQIAQAAQAGAFGTPVLVTFTPSPVPIVNPTLTSTTTTPVVAATTYPTLSTTVVHRRASSSDPALLGLLALLIIPVLCLLLLFCWPKPAVCCPPCPCPGPYSYQGV